MTFTGLYVPLVTPFTAADEVAGDALEALAHQCLDAGFQGRRSTPSQPRTRPDGPQTARPPPEPEFARGSMFSLVSDRR
ncbi:hypothetical protein [Nocardia sp. NPDC004722]